MTNEDKSQKIDTLFEKNNIDFKREVLAYFRKEYPHKRFSLSEIEDMYYDLTDNNHIENIYDNIAKKY